MFTNRKDAALQLASALSKYRDHNVIVLGIPRGGVEIAYYVASHLNAEFSMIIVRKLGHPENPEFAFGAMAEDGSLYLTDEASQPENDEEMNQVIEEERNEIQRRIKKLRQGKSLPSLKDRIVIIVDDGIATGATLLAAIAMCRKMKPSKLIVGAPIASKQMEYRLQKLVDSVVILKKPDYFHAVGQGYRDFNNLTDEETMAFIDAWENRLKNAS